MQDLYEISQEYQTLKATLTEMVEDGHIDEECFQNTLSPIKGDLESKCINLSKMIKNKEAYIAGLEAREKEIKERLKSISIKIKNSKSYNEFLSNILKNAMDDMNLDKIDTPDFLIRKVGKKQSVVVKDESLIPEQYLITKEISSVDKAFAYEHLKKGIDIPGLSLGESKRLEIK